MKYGWVILFLCLGACNQKLHVQKMVSLDGELAEYAQEFVAEGKAAGVNVVIDNLSLHFGANLGGTATTTTLGECWMMNRGVDGTPRVLISSDEWPNLTPIRRKALVFHELGHCVLWLEHDETMITLSGYYVPKSIMYPFLGDDATYTMFWAYYSHELFTGQ